MSQRFEQRQEQRDQEGADVEELRWPGKRTKVDAAMAGMPADAATAESDPRRPDIARIRAAIGGLTSGGEKLDAGIAGKFGDQLGVDLSSVTIHKDNQDAAAMGASAFTHGDHVAVAPGVDLASEGGQHVLAHELVHVAQNMSAGGSAMEFAARMDVGPSNSPAESQAEAGASALLSGQSFSAGGIGALPGISMFEGPPPASTPTPAPTGNAPQQEQFGPNDPRNPDYDPSKDPTVLAQLAQVPPTPSTAQTATPPPTPAPKPEPAVPPAPTTKPASTQPTPAPASPNRPSIGPAPTPSPAKTPAPTQNLDELVKAELEKRADPQAKQQYSNATNQIDILRIQAVQYSFQPTGLGTNILASLWPWEAWKQHGREISLTNPYDAGSLQAWIEGARATIRILGDVAAWVATIADIVAAVSGLLALISSWTGAGLVIFGAIAAIAAEVGTIAGLIKIILDIIDVVIGVVQMILTIKKIKASKDPAERAKLAALLGREVKEVSGAVIGIGVQVVTIVATAGLAAGVTGMVNKSVKGFWKNFGKELFKEFRPILAPRQSIQVIKDAAALGVRAPKAAIRENVDPKTITQKEIADGAVTVERIERRRELVKTKLSRAQRKKRGKLREWREVVTTSNKPVLSRKDLKIPKGDKAVKREVRFIVDPNKLKQGIPHAEIEGFAVDTSAIIPGQTAGQVQARAKKTGDATSPQKPNAQLPGTDAPVGTSPLTQVPMWPTQLEKLKATRTELPPANDRLMTMYNLAKGQAGTYQSGQFEKVFAGVKNAAGQMRLGALTQQQDATAGAEQSQKGEQTAKQGVQQKGQLDGKTAAMDQSTQKMGAQKVEKPPPKEGGSWWDKAKNWLYNQTIGRIGDAIGGLQGWLQKSIGGWVMAQAGLTKEELDMAGIENSMRADHQKDKQTEAEMKAAQEEANKVDPKLAEIMKGANADEQAALQAMMESQEFMTAIDEAVKGLDEAIAAGNAYITEVSPIIRHELETQQGGKPIDAAYVAPVIGGANSLKGAVGGGEEMAAPAAADVIGELGQAQEAWPELNIQPGIAAVGTAKQAFITAHAQLVGGINTAADGVIGKVNGLIGTTEYEAVLEAAHSLDGAMDKFLEQEDALAEVYIRNLESILDATAALIQSAVTQEEVDVPVDEAPVQRKADGGAANDNADPQAVAARGTQGAGGQLPHLDQIQRSFGKHDVSGVQAHVGGDAAGASKDLGAKAFATGNKVAFADSPDLHTAAHEAAHVVQQRSGVSLKAIDGGSGDAHEKHADAVADAVVSGKSAEGLLDAGASGAAPVQRKEADAPQPPQGDGKDDKKKKDPAQEAANKALAKPNKGGEPDENPDAKKDVAPKDKPVDAKDAGKKPAADAGKDKGKDKAAAAADPKAAAKKDEQAPPAPKGKAAADAVKPVPPADTVQPGPVAPVAPIQLVAPTSNKQLDDKWIKDSGRTPAAHHAQIQSDLDALTAEIQAKQNELMTFADTEITKITADVQGKVAGFTSAIVVPGRARVEAAFGGMTKTIDQAEAKAKADIAAAKVQGTTQITTTKNQKGVEIANKFKTAKSGNEALVKKNAPAAAAVIKKFAAQIKPFVDKAKLDATNATNAISAEHNPAAFDAATGGLPAGTASLRADAMKNAITAHGKKLAADYEGKLVAIGKEVETGANRFVEEALKPAKDELDIALDVVDKSAKKNLDNAEIAAKAQLDTQEQASTKAVADAKVGGQQKWTAEKATAIENADKAGKALSDNTTAAGTELTSRIKKKAADDAKNYGMLATEIQQGLRKGGPKKYEEIAPRIADAKNRLATGHAQNRDELQKLVTTGATELGATLGKQQEIYQQAIKAQEDQAKVVEASILRDVTKGATDMTGSLTGLSKGFDEAVTKETVKIDTATQEFTTNANAALADFDKKCQDKLAGIKAQLDAGLQADLAKDKVNAKALPVAEKEIKAKQKQLIKDAGGLRKAMDGWGTDENAIYAILRKCSWGEIEFLEATYDNHYDNRGKDGLTPLRYDLQDELDSSELAIATAYLNHNRQEAIKLELADSVGFWNDDEKRIEEVMRSCSEEEITHLNTDPASKAVVAKVKDALGGADLDVVNTLLDQNMSREDRATKANAIRLFDAMEGWGTDEAKVKELLTQASTPEERQRLRAQFNAYAASKNWPQGSGVEGDDALDLALKDDFGSGEVLVVTELAKTQRDEKMVKMAKLIEAADGVGTDEDAMFDALDDEEYAQQWKALNEKAKTDPAAVQQLKDLEAAHEKEMNDRLKKLDPDAEGGVMGLINSESTKSYITWQEFTTKTRKNGLPVTDLDRRRLMGNVVPEEGESDGSGYLEWMVAQRKLQTGQAEPELLLAYACWGVAGTHEELINKVLGDNGEPKPFEQVKKICDDFAAIWETPLVANFEIKNPQGSVPDDQMQFPDPGGLLSAELGGKDWLTTRVLLCGVPTTAPELRYVQKLQIHYAKSGLLAKPLMWAAEKTGYSDAAADQRNSEKKFDAKYAQIAAQLGGKLDATTLANIGKDAKGNVQKDAEGNDVATGDDLQLLSEYLQQDTEAYAKALASVVDAIVTVLEIVGGIIVTVVTAGTAAPVLAAIIGNLIVSAGTIAFKYAALGDQYGAGDLAKDVTTAAITAGFAGLGEVKALKTLTENAGKATTGALFRTVNEGVNAGGGRLIGTTIELGPKGISTIQGIVREGTKNVIISGGQEVANFLTDEKTYEMKLGEALWGENSLGARLAKSLPKAFVEGGVKQFIDDVALVSNKDNRGGHKTPFGNMLANALSDAGANVAGFFVYVDNYNDAGTFWDELLKSTGKKAASGFFQGYGMHKMRAKKTGRDFINGEIDQAGLIEMLTYLDPKEVRELGEFVKKYGGDKVHALPDQFKKELGLTAPKPVADPASKPAAPVPPDGAEPVETKKDDDTDARAKQDEAKRQADLAEQQRKAAEAEQLRLQQQKEQADKEAAERLAADKLKADKEAAAKLAADQEKARLQAIEDAKAAQRLKDEQRVRDEAFDQHEKEQKAKVDRESDAAHQQKRDQEAKLKQEQTDQMFDDQADAAARDAARAKRDADKAKDAKEGKLPTLDEVVQDQNNEKQQKKPGEQVDDTGTAPKPTKPVAPADEPAPTATVRIPPAADMVAQGNKIYQHYNEDEHFEKFNTWAKANPAKPMPELAFSGISSDALDAIIQTGLKSGRALGKAPGANADNIWFKAGAPFYFDSVTMVIPAGRLRDLGGQDTVGLAGQKDVMTMPYATRPDGIPASEFAIVYSIGHGYVIPLHVPEGWSHPIGQLPPADMLPPGFEHLANGPKKTDTPDPKAKPVTPATADATPAPTKTDGDDANPAVGSHKGKDTFQPRTTGEGENKQLVKYTPDELKKSIVDLPERPGHEIKVGTVTDTAATMTMKVRTKAGETVDVEVQVNVSSNLTPTTAHDTDAGAARFTLDPKDGKWKATIELAQGLDPRDIKFVVGHEVDEIADIVSKHPTGNAKKAMADEMTAGVTRDNDRGTKIKSHDIAAAKEVVELFVDWQLLVADGHPDAARRKETLDRALKANNLENINDAKLALLTEVDAPAALINHLRKPAEPEPPNKKPAMTVEPGKIPADVPADKKKLFEEAADLHKRLKESSFHGPDFADLKWHEFLQSHGLNVESPIRVKNEGYKDQAMAASDTLLDKDTPSPKSMPDAGGTVPKDNAVSPRSPTVKYMGEPVSKAAFAEMASNPTGFKVVSGAGSERIEIEVTLADGSTKRQFVRRAEPSEIPGGGMAGMRVDGDEIHVWVSHHLPDDQAHRAFGAIMGRVVAKVKESGGDGPQDPAKAATIGQIDGLLGHLEATRKKNEAPLEELPTALPADHDPKKDKLAVERAKAADRNSKRESEERIASEIDLLLQQHPDLVKDLPAPLKAKVEEHLKQRTQLGFNPNAMIDPANLPKKPVDEPTDRPSTVLPGAPKNLRPYSEADKQTISELKVVFETIKEIDSRLQQRDQTDTSDRKAPTIAAGETMRRKALVEQAKVLMEKLQLGGTDPAYYNQRLTELDAVIPGAKAAIGDHVTTRVTKRNEADQAHKDAQEYAARAQVKSQEIENMLAATGAEGSKPFTCDRIVVGDGPTGLANIAGLTEKGGIKPDGDGFIDPKKMLVVGGPDLIAKMAESGPNMRWGQRPEVFDGDEGSHPIFRGERKGELQRAAEDPGDFSTVGQVHDAMDNARSKMGVARAQATVLKVELQDGPGVENWAAADHPVRVTMVVNGVKVVVYTKNTDITTGIGTARLPDESILSAKDRKKLVDGPNKVMVNGEDAMMQKEFLGEKVLVIGYGPTGAWAAIEAQRRGATSVDWGGTSAQLPRDAKAKSGDRASTPEDQFGSLKGVDRVQETLDPTKEINVTTDRIAKIEAQGAGAVVTYARGEPPDITTYQVHYTKVINAGQPVSDAASKTAAQPSAPKSGDIVGGLPLAPQEHTDAPVWATKDDRVRVMGPGTGGVSGTPAQNQEIARRGDSIPRRADSPDPRVMESTGVAVDRANGIDPDANPAPTSPKPNKKPTDTTDGNDTTTQPKTDGAPVAGSHKGKDVYPTRTDGTDGQVAKYSSDDLTAGLAPLAGRTGAKVAAAKVEEVTATGAKVTVKVKTDAGEVEIVVNVKVADSLNPADAHDGDGGAARFTLDRQDGQWKAEVSLAQGLHPQDIKFVVGHELDEIADLASKHPSGKAMKTGEPARPGDAHKSHEIAAANEVVALWRDLKELEAGGKSAEAQHRRETLERALKANHLDTLDDAKRALLKEIGAPEELIRELDKAVAPVATKKVKKNEGDEAEDPAAAPARTPEEKFLDDVRAQLAGDPDHETKFGEIVGKRKPKSVFDQFKGDVDAAVKMVHGVVAKERAATAKTNASSSQLKKFVEDNGLMNDPQVQGILASHRAAIEAADGDVGATKKANGDALQHLRSFIMSNRAAENLRTQFGEGHTVRRDVLIMKEHTPPAGEEPYASVEDFKKRTNHDSKRGVRMVDTPEGKRIYVEVTDIDLLVTQDKAGAGGKDAIVKGEEVKTGANDTQTKASKQQDEGFKALTESTAGGPRVKLFQGTTDITADIDVSSLTDRKNLQTRGPDEKGFENSLGIKSAELDKLVQQLIDTAEPAKPETKE